MPAVMCELVAADDVDAMASLNRRSPASRAPSSTGPGGASEEPVGAPA
jgi:hypothetical protein